MSKLKFTNYITVLQIATEFLEVRGLSEGLISYFVCNMPHKLFQIPNLMLFYLLFWNPGDVVVGQEIFVVDCLKSKKIQCGILPQKGNHISLRERFTYVYIPLYTYRIYSHRILD